ncbi:Uncharacterised protein [Mycobacteroides abscessus]|nr:Uncharacterised protein [Mycobacteroides abscessus]
MRLGSPVKLNRYGAWRSISFAFEWSMALPSSGACSPNMCRMARRAASGPPIASTSASMSYASYQWYCQSVPW